MSTKARRPRNTSRQREAGAASRQETRRRLVQAAGELFAERGYAGATVTAIAERAGVSLQTLYLAWGSKRQLLRAFTEQSLSGSPTAVTDATWPEQARARVEDLRGGKASPEERLRAFARLFREVAERAALSWQLHRDAAGADPEIAADRAELERLRRRTLSTALRDLEPSRLRMDFEQTIDTVMVIAGPDSYHALVVGAGYSLDRYEQWVGDTLIAALLRAA